MQLNDKAHAQYGRQCCGGEVTYLLEPLAVVPAAAIFGMGHVGLESASCPGTTSSCTASIHARLSSSQERLRCSTAPSRGCTFSTPLPQLVLGTVPRGTHVLILTHDHAEDPRCATRPFAAATSDRSGSSARRSCGHGSATSPPDEALAWAVDRITSPIRMPELPGKEPAAIAVSVAADLLRSFATENSTSRHDDLPGPGTGHPGRPVQWAAPSVLTATPDCAWSTESSRRGARSPRSGAHTPARMSSTSAAASSCRVWWTRTSTTRRCERSACPACPCSTGCR